MDKTQNIKKSGSLKLIREKLDSQLMEYINLSIWKPTPDIEFQLFMLQDHRFLEELVKNNPINLVVNIQALRFANETHEAISVVKITDHDKIRLSVFEKIILDNLPAVKKIDELPSILENQLGRITLDTYIQINDEEIYIILGRAHARF